ncbi:TetR family transcriptional regulator [bacterium]|nr:TetR family transcriptional regulator [bacterium]
MVVRSDLMKAHYSDVLMAMCETRRLSEITASDVIKAAGTARQTFYNHFSDLDDLVGYAASRGLLTGARPVYDKENLRATYEYALAHRSFFNQIPSRIGPNDFRAATIRWLKESSYPLFISNDMPQRERDYRRVRLDVYFVGEVNAIVDWFASDMAMPVDTLLDAVWDSAPAFMKSVSARTPTNMPTYPR